MVTLVIVRSPAKAKKIQTFLGKSTVIKSDLVDIFEIYISRNYLSIQRINSNQILLYTQR